jgi:hypothetical protein
MGAAESVAHVLRNLTGSDALSFSVTAPKLENATRHFTTLTAAVEEIGTSPRTARDTTHSL